MKIRLESFCDYLCDCPTCHTGSNKSTEPEECYYCQHRLLQQGRYGKATPEITDLINKLKPIKETNTPKITKIKDRGYLEDIFCEKHNPQGHAADNCPKCKVKITKICSTFELEKDDYIIYAKVFTDGTITLETGDGHDQFKFKRSDKKTIEAISNMFLAIAKGKK